MESSRSMTALETMSLPMGRQPSKRIHPSNKCWLCYARLLRRSWHLLSRSLMSSWRIKLVTIASALGCCSQISISQVTFSKSKMRSPLQVNNIKNGQPIGCPFLIQAHDDLEIKINIVQIEGFSPCA